MLDLEPSILPSVLNFCHCAMAGGYPFIRKPAGVDAIWLWGRAKGEFEPRPLYGDSLLELAATLHQETGAPVVIPGYCGAERGQGPCGYAGPSEWGNILQQLGVDPQHILSTAGDGINTMTEFEDCVLLIRKHQWQRLIGLTTQMHALRAMLGTVQTLRDRRILHDVKVFPLWPTSFDLRQIAHGSQGKGPLPRIDWINQEFDRVPRYMEKGDLCRLENLADYLRLLVSE